MGFAGDVFLPCIGGVLVWIISVLLLFCCFQNSKNLCFVDVYLVRFRWVFFLGVLWLILCRLRLFEGPQ